jgi:hypothetical protein
VGVRAQEITENNDEELRDVSRSLPKSKEINNQGTRPICKVGNNSQVKGHTKEQREWDFYFNVLRKSTRTLWHTVDASIFAPHLIMITSPAQLPAAVASHQDTHLDHQLKEARQLRTGRSTSDHLRPTTRKPVRLQTTPAAETAQRIVSECVRLERSQALLVPVLTSRSIRL